MKTRWLWILACAALIVSCAPFSRNVMRQVNPALMFDEVQQNPDRYLGQVVIWGGKIIETVNQTDRTDIKVTQTDLDIEKRPTNTDSSRGRFIIRYPGFLDPAIYSPGRLITAVGEVAGREVQPVGKTQYAYPVILAKEIRLWEPVQRYRYYPSPWYWDPYPYHWYGPYWRHRHPFWW